MADLSAAEGGSRCDDTGRPDFLHFDLEPVPPATFERVRETALRTRDALRKLGIKPFVKTSGSKGLHVYVHSVRPHAEAGVDLRQGDGVRHGGGRSDLTPLL